MSRKLAIAEYKSNLIPTDPGIYLFRHKSQILYIGKASNLRKRVSSYFRKNIGDKVRQLRQEADSLELISLNSEIEALLKEAELIKRHVPKFNVLMRDDKNYAYVAITDEIFPKIFITHQPTNPHKKINARHNGLTFIGPFTSGASLKITLKLLRKLFPYCTCNSPHKRTCLNSQLGICPGYCCWHGNANTDHIVSSFTDKYQTHVDTIIAILTGKRKHIVTNLKKQMQHAIAAQNFEQAAWLRDQYIGIENVINHRLHLIETGTKKKKYQKNWNTTEKNIKMVLNIDRQISRAEGYDISHISGASSTGSMVVFIDGMPSRNDYRMFKIKTIQGISDVDMLKEVMQRRLNHTEWTYPDLIIIDGGKPQLNAVMSVISRYAPMLMHRVVSLAKREEELYSPHHAHTIRLDSLPLDTGFFFQRVRDESHRFAKQYHHKLREISYQPTKKLLKQNETHSQNKI